MSPEPAVPPGPQPPIPPTSLSAEVLDLVSTLAHEIHPHLRTGPRLGLDSNLDTAFGLDSLGRVEAVHRLEIAFNVSLGDRLFAEAKTPADLALAITQAGPVRPETARGPVASRTAPAAQAAPSVLETLPQVLAWHARHNGERAHVYPSDGDAEAAPITYRDLLAGASRIAAGLGQKGLEPGARVALMLSSGQSFLTAFMGVLLANGVPVPIYPPWRMSRVEEHIRRQGRILAKAGAWGLITWNEALPFARLLRDLTPSLTLVAAADQIVGAEGAPQSSPFPAPDDLALIQFTSGSTADPKGVMLSHANILANARGLARAIQATPADVYVSWLPLSHDMGLIGAWLACLDQAAPLVLMSPLSFLARPERWLWTIHRNRATITAAPNFAFEQCLSIPAERLVGLDLSSLRVAGCGAEAISPVTVRDFTARFAGNGFRPEAFLPVYGLAESAAALTAAPLGRRPWVDHVDRQDLTARGRARPASPEADDAAGFVSCGSPLIGHEVRIVDQAGREAPERQEGRLQFRGPSATRGYFEAPEKTAELFQDGWLESGDLAYVAEGEVFVTGRTKDIVKRAGRNIHPADVEGAVSRLAGAGGAVLFSVADPARDVERLVLAIETPLTGAPERAALLQAVQEIAMDHLDTALDDIFFLQPGAIPRTESGKVRRTALAQAYAQGAGTGDGASPARQVRRLARTALLGRLRRGFQAASERLYAWYWWTVIIGLGIVVWPLVVAAPRLHWRWQVVHGASRLALSLLGHRLTVEGPGRPARSGNVVYVANHASYLDSLVLSAILPGDLVFPAFKGLAEQPFQGRFAGRLGVLFVERFEPSEAVTDMGRAVKAVRQGRPLVMFPEATATRAPGLLDFRMGAFVAAAETGAPVIPVTMRGTRAILRHDRRWFPRRGSIQVRIGAPLQPRGRDFDAALALKNAARADILAHVHEPDIAAEAPQF